MKTEIKEGEERIRGELEDNWEIISK